MVLGMSNRVWGAQKAPRIMKIDGFKGLRGWSLKLHILKRGPINSAPLWLPCGFLVDPQKVKKTNNYVEKADPQKAGKNNVIKWTPKRRKAILNTFLRGGPSHHLSYYGFNGTVPYICVYIESVFLVWCLTSVTRRGGDGSGGRDVTWPIGKKISSQTHPFKP